MTRTSYALNAKYLPFMFLIMFLLIFMIMIMIFASFEGSFRLVMLSFALIGIICLIVIAIVLLQKSSVSSPKVDEYKL